MFLSQSKNVEKVHGIRNRVASDGDDAQHPMRATEVLPFAVEDKGGVASESVSSCFRLLVGGYEHVWHAGCLHHAESRRTCVCLRFWSARAEERTETTPGERFQGLVRVAMIRRMLRKRCRDEHSLAVFTFVTLHVRGRRRENLKRKKLVQVKVDVTGSELARWVYLHVTRRHLPQLVRMLEIFALSLEPGVDETSHCNVVHGLLLKVIGEWA